MRKFLKANGLKIGITKAILYLLVFKPILVSAQHTPDLNHKAFQNIISLKFDAASQNLKKSREANPANPYSLFLENYMQFIRCAIDGDEDSYRHYQVSNTARVAMLANNSEDAAIYFQAEMNFHSFLLALYHQENLKALKKFLQAYSQVDHFVKNIDNPEAGQKLQGVFLVILSGIPDEYKWITSLIGLNGDLSKGIAMLEEHMQLYEPGSAEYLESIIIITLLKNMFRQDYPANFNYLKNLPAGYLENPLFRLVYTVSASKSGHNDEVLKTLRTFHQDPGEHKICYFDYLYGEALLNRLDRDAESSLQSYIHCIAGNIYLKSAYRKLAWNHLIHGDTVSFLSYRKLVLDSGSMKADIDKQAYHEFALQDIPNIDLIKARLLFDGGYYQQAKSLLLKKEIREGLKDVYQQTEYSYRLARIYHMNNETDMAIRLYQLTLKNGIHYPFYYAAYSALQLGIIYERRGDVKNARLYYHKVLETPEESFGYRFHHSAGEGLKRPDQVNAAH
jgi:hypothetical protein